MPMPQLPAAQPATAFGSAGHITPHAPHAFTFVARTTSQPFATMPSQSAKPIMQVKPQPPSSHVGTAFARAGHSVPQVPQFARSLVVLISHPLAAVLSQSAKPSAHIPIPQALALQAAVALAGVGQTLSQPPQCAVSFAVLMQDITSDATQMVPGAGQSIWQCPATQSWVAGHALPHAPQLAGSVMTSGHVVAAPVPHAVRPALHMTAHPPALHVGAPPVGAVQTVPHAPQLAMVEVRSTHAPPQRVSPVGHPLASCGSGASTGASLPASTLDAASIVDASIVDAASTSVVSGGHPTARAERDKERR